MHTVVQSAIFERYARSIWNDAELDDFVSWIAAHPLAGDVIPETGGCRKVRWARAGMGKRSGARVVYFNTLVDGRIWLLIAHSKAKFDDLPHAFLNQLRETICG
ncbi:MAG: transcriptional regulator [Lysobacterales bacterium CG02_land_8_20_14_3_00_62_12]|nr:MAG: transcriptional regulator [Xanthomonadales bacterium CG02_land_8_20_14_3_00_62_12]